MSRARVWPGLSDIDRSIDIALSTGYQEWSAHKHWVQEMPDGEMKGMLADELAKGEAALIADNIDRAKLHFERVNSAHLRQTVLLPLARTGQRAAKQRAAAGFSSGEQRGAERKPEWDTWQKAAEDIFRANPTLTKTQICIKVGHRFGVHHRTVSNRITGVGKKVGKERRLSNS